MEEASRRLQEAAANRNAHPDHRYEIQFSIGAATLNESCPESLEAMVRRADEAMYLVKRGKKPVTWVAGSVEIIDVN